MKPTVKSPTDSFFPMKIHLEADDPQQDRLRTAAKAVFNQRVSESNGRRKAARLVAWMSIIPLGGLVAFAFLDNACAVFLCYAAFSAILLLSQRIGKARSWGVSVDLRKVRDE